MVVKFTGLADHDLTFSAATTAADDGQFSADDGGRVFPGAHQHLGDHRGGGGLSVGAADSNTIIIVLGEDAQQLRPLEHRNTAGFGRDELRVVRQDRSCVDDQIGAFDILRLLTNGYRDSHLLLGSGGIGGIVVRTGDVVAGIG